MNKKTTFFAKENLDDRANAFVAARLSAGALETYPGTPPATIKEAYAIQDDAVEAIGQEIAGWKVGRITGDWESRLGADRLAGPVFSDQLVKFTGDQIDMPVFSGGFAAIEAEITIVVAKDAPEGKTDWSLEDAKTMIKSIHLGVEIASSPFTGINDHGPLVTISDFGNNYGLILGAEIENWTSLDPSAWSVTLSIEDREFGPATPAAMPGGPLESFRFLLENVTRRGLPIKAGMAICTGAVTGVHIAKVGEAAVAKCANAEIKCRLTAA